MKKKKKEFGGLALYNGIKFESSTRDVIAKRDSDGKVFVRISNYIEEDEKFSFSKLPFIRLIYNAKNILYNLKYNMKESLKSNYEKYNIEYSNKDLSIGYLSIILLVLFFIFIYMILPFLISLPFDNYNRIIMASLQTIFVILSGFAIRFVPFFSDFIEYHGAEHKIINAYEKLDKEELTLEDVKNVTRIHKRCGTNFISLFFIFNILEILFLPIENMFLRLGMILVLILPNILVAFELIFLLNKIPSPISYIFYPIYLVQLFTTKNPSDDKLIVGLYGINGLIKEKLDISISEYITKYSKKNEEIIKDSDYTIKDMLKIVEILKNKPADELFIDMDNITLNYNEQIELERLFDMLFTQNIPLQYITNTKYFYNEKYYVDNRVLIPRDDSEILVQKAIEYITNYNLKDMIDLCTGSGCIGISVAKNSNIEKVILSDISKDAIEVAKKNVRSNNVIDKVSVCTTNLLDFYIANKNKIDIITANPPYIKTDVLNTLSERVKKEPYIALDGGKDGIDFYEKILKQATKILNENGFLIFEIGYDELNDLKNVISKYNEYIFVEAVKDLGGNDRVIVLQYNAIIS